MTRRVEVTFSVKEYANEKPFIVMETLQGDDMMPEIRRKLVGFDLQEGITFGEANDLAILLRDQITHFTLTDLSSSGSDPVTA